MSPYLSNKSGDSHNVVQSHTKTIFPDIDADPTCLPSSLDPFTITTSSGFLPLLSPLVDLPAAFKPLTAILEAMPIVKLNGQPGLLATYSLGPTIDIQDTLPDLTTQLDSLVVDDGKPDLHAITAAFRDYAFLASAYLLEPCWKRWSRGIEGYGLGRERLPHCIAGPLVKAADLLYIPPFMSYAAAYTLFNYRFEDPAVGASEYGNLRLIRAFEHGLDPKSSEAGFVLTHIDMVQHSPSLIQGAVQMLDAVASDSGNAGLVNACELLLNGMEVIEASMETMWSHSKPKDYLGYRTFIFGITNQSMFPNGVVYEGIKDNRPMFFRGESGANDSMIPLLDALLQIPMPQNPLTETLKDFRSYRPKPHREFLAYVLQRAEEIGVRAYCCKDLETKVLYLRLLNHVRSFRWRHWLFAREYIIKRSSHPSATGGSPIITWLPNQLFAVMELMIDLWGRVPVDQRAELDASVLEMMDEVEQQYGKLQKEVGRYCQERGV